MLFFYHLFFTALQDNISIFENSSGNEMLSYLSFSDSTVNHVLTVTPSGPFSIDVYNSTGTLSVCKGES